MIKVQEIVTDNFGRKYDRIDKLIEEYLSRKKSIELIDIKYQVSSYKVGYDIVHRTSALIVYKDKN